MYKTLLVDADIQDGRQVVSSLENAGLKIAAAFWLHSEERDEWELVIVSPDVAEKGSTQVYKEHFATLHNMQTELPRPLNFWWDRIKIVSPSSLSYETVKHHSGLRCGPVREGPALDAYIYKMT
jgi:hypothetical protein